MERKRKQTTIGDGEQSSDGVLIDAQAIIGGGEGEVLDSQESDRVRPGGRGAFAPIHEVDKGLSNSVFGNARPLGLDRSAVNTQDENPLPNGHQRNRGGSLGGRQVNTSFKAKR